MQRPERAGGEKKEKKAKKAKTGSDDADDKKAERDRKKKESANLRLATKVIAKLQPLYITLQRDLNDPMLRHVADFAKGPAKKFAAEVQQILQGAENIAKNRGAGTFPSKLSNDYVESVSRDAAAAASLLEKMLSTARIHAS